MQVDGIHHHHDHPLASFELSTLFTELIQVTMAHSQIDPAILYWGTPVLLISTINEDGTSNIGPMSSAFWLGDRCMLGLAKHSKTPENLFRTSQCVLNLPSDDMGAAVNALARTTGTKDVPESKFGRGYRFEKDKFAIANLTPQPSETVEPPRITECPVQMEAELVGRYDALGGAIAVVEVRILRTHVLDELRLKGHANRIDPDAWHPMIMSFQHLYGLRAGKIANSRLAKIDEELYRLSTLIKRHVPESGPEPE